MIKSFDLGLKKIADALKREQFNYLRKLKINPKDLLTAAL